MFTPVEVIPREELARRHGRCRALLARLCPEAGGLMAFGSTTIYYLTGTHGSGVFWLPLEGEPLLMARKGFERARMESSLSSVASFRSYGDIAGLAEQFGVPLSPVVAAEQSRLPWSLADMLQKKLAGVRFIAGDAVLARSRAVKTPWELAKMRSAGARHAKALYEVLPTRIHPGMSELAVAHQTSDVFFSLGSCAIARLSNFGEEMYLGHIGVSANGNYPSFYNGALGALGIHPSAPFMGNADVIWEKNSLLSHDCGFCFEGYNSDTTVTYFAGKKSNIPAPIQKAQDVCMEIERVVTEHMLPGAIPSQLYALGLDMAEKAGYGEGFMGLHGNKVPFLGHSLGLYIDDWPVLAARFDEPLEAGMTLAVEPKIALPGIGMVGTEHSYEITPSGAVSLSGDWKDIVCIE